MCSYCVSVRAQILQHMHYKIDPLNLIFQALADPGRRGIVERLCRGPASVSELADSYEMSFAAVQKHVAVLEGAGLVTKEPQGRSRIVRGNPEQIARAQSLLDTYANLWRGRIERLDALLAGDEN